MSSNKLLKLKLTTKQKTICKFIFYFYLFDDFIFQFKVSDPDLRLVFNSGSDRQFIRIRNTELVGVPPYKYPWSSRSGLHVLSSSTAGRGRDIHPHTEAERYLYLPRYSRWYLAVLPSSTRYKSGSGRISFFA